MLTRNPKRTFVVIVPTIPLKDQWISKIIGMKLPINQFKVLVINGLTINQLKLSTTLLVLDEIHLYLNGPIFSQVFDLVERKFTLGLSATIDRESPGYNLIRLHCPIIDTITQQEAIENDWVADYKEFVLQLDLNPDERMELDSLNADHIKYFGKFQYDFKLAMGCLSDKGLKLRYAQQMGWTSSLGKFHPWSPDRIGFYSVMFNRSMQKRKAFLYDLPSKVEKVRELFEKFDKCKTIVFSESTKFADKVTEVTSPEGISYHSYIPTEIREVKNKKGETVQKKFGKKRLQTEILKKFEDGRYKLSLLSTAKALNQGQDLPSAKLGIIASYNSNSLTSIQRRGRVIRKYINKDGTEKRSVIIYFAVKDSQEEKWLKKALNMSSPLWTNSVDYIVENAFVEENYVQQD